MVDKTSSSFSAHGKIGNIIIIINTTMKMTIYTFLHQSYIRKVFRFFQISHLFIRFISHLSYFVFPIIFFSFCDEELASKSRRSHILHPIVSHRPLARAVVQAYILSYISSGVDFMGPEWLEPPPIFEPWAHAVYQPLNTSHI